MRVCVCPLAGARLEGVAAKSASVMHETSRIAVPLPGGSIASLGVAIAGKGIDSRGLVVENGARRA